MTIFITITLIKKNVQTIQEVDNILFSESESFNIFHIVFEVFHEKRGQI